MIPSVASKETNAMGVAPTRNWLKLKPALLPMKMPTGLPSMVAAEPMLVQSTAIITKGADRILSVSQTWKTRASTTTMEETSSTTLDSRADKPQRMIVKVVPFICFLLMIA